VAIARAPVFIRPDLQDPIVPTRSRRTDTRWKRALHPAVLLMGTMD